MSKELALEKVVLDLATGQTVSDFEDEGPSIDSLKSAFSNLPVTPRLDRNVPTHAAILRAYPKNRNARRQFAQTTSGTLVFDRFGNLAMHHPTEFNVSWRWTCGEQRPGMAPEKRDFVLLWEHFGRLILAINTGTMERNLLVELNVTSGEELSRTYIPLMFGAFFAAPHLIFYDSQHYGLFDLKEKRIIQSWGGQLLNLYSIPGGKHLALTQIDYDHRYEWRMHAPDWSQVLWSHMPKWAEGVPSGSVLIEGGSIDRFACIEKQEVRTKTLRFEVVYREVTSSTYK